MICLAIFTVSSLLCGLAPSLGSLLFFRVLQGAGGGGLQPMAQAILADTFPPEKRGLAFALFGITAVTAPTIGPTLGGWITFSYSWRWIFFINLPVGAITWLLVRRFVEDPPYLKRLKTAGVKLDYLGIAFLTVGIGALQILLDKGQEDDWFGSNFITALVIISARVPDLSGGMGVVSESAHHRCPHVQESEIDDCCLIQKQKGKYDPVRRYDLPVALLGRDIRFQKCTEFDRLRLQLHRALMTAMA